MKKAQSRTLGDRVRMLREEYNLNQTEFGNVISKSHVAIGNIETGATEHPQNGTLKAIAGKFGTTLDWLQKEEGPMFPHGKLDLNVSVVEPTPWKDEAYQAVKSENNRLAKEIERLWQMIGHMSGGKVNFLRVLGSAGSKEAQVVKLQPSGDHSGTKLAAC